MAEATGLNVNTVRAVYRRLEQRGLIDSQQGSGTFVVGAPSGAAALSSIAANAAMEARETGLDPRDVAAALYVAPEHAARSPSGAGGVEPERSPAARRRALRDQIATLERTLAELEAEHPGVAPAPARARRGTGPALLTVDELARVRAALIRRLTVVQAALDEHLEAQRHDSRRASEVATAKAKPSARKARSKPARAIKPVEQPAGAAERPPRPRLRTRPAPASG